jgi:hypothetical protein
MKNFIYCIVPLFLLLGCKSLSKSELKSDCGNTFEVQYDNGGKYKLSKKERDKNYITVYFESDFNDRIKIDINHKEVFNKEVITNDRKPDDYSDAFVYKMNSEDKTYLLKGVSERNKTCFEVPINPKYRIIYLFYYQGQWAIRFSNSMRII